MELMSKCKALLKIDGIQIGAGCVDGSMDGAEHRWQQSGSIMPMRVVFVTDNEGNNDCRPSTTYCAAWHSVNYIYVSVTLLMWRVVQWTMLMMATMMKLMANVAQLFGVLLSGSFVK